MTTANHTKTEYNPTQRNMSQAIHLLKRDSTFRSSSLSLSKSFEENNMSSSSLSSYTSYCSSSSSSSICWYDTSFSSSSSTTSANIDMLHAIWIQMNNQNSILMNDNGKSHLAPFDNTVTTIEPDMLFVTISNSTDDTDILTGTSEYSNQSFQSLHHSTPGMMQHECNEQESLSTKQYIDVLILPEII